MAELFYQPGSWPVKIFSIGHIEYIYTIRILQVILFPLRKKDKDITKQMIRIEGESKTLLPQQIRR